MALAGRFREIVDGLPDDWESLSLRLTIFDDADCGRAAALLGPVNPGRRGKVITFSTARRGDGAAPGRVAALLARIDAETIKGAIVALAVREAPAPSGPARPSFADAWDAELATLPADWSDLYAEIELPSSDYIEPGALRLSPLNPTRPDARPLFRFRAARRFGYGAAPEMVRRCLERLDEAGIRGDLRTLQVFSDTHPASTQGPVWYEAGKVI